MHVTEQATPAHLADVEGLSSVKEGLECGAELVPGAWGARSPSFCEHRDKGMHHAVHEVLLGCRRPHSETLKIDLGVVVLSGLYAIRAAK